MILNLAKLMEVSIGVAFALLTVTWVVGCIDMFDISLIPIFDSKEFYAYFKWSLLTVFAAVLWIMSPLSDRMVSLFFPIRKISFREEQKIKQAVIHIREQYFNIYGKYPKLKVKVQDIPYPEAMAFGKHTIVVSTGLLKACSDEELTAVIAHETGHLHYKDGVMNLLNIVAWMLILAFTWLCLYSYRRPETELTIGNQMTLLDIFTVVMVLILMFYFPQYFFFMILVGGPMHLTLNAMRMWFDWPTEYRADRFAASLGFGSGLIAFFERIEGEDIRNKTGFLSYFKYSHPPVALRIDRIEKSFMKI